MNLVLGDCDEFGKLPPAKDKKNEDREDHRTLGLVCEEVVSMTVECPLPRGDSWAKTTGASAMAGTGLGRASGRGIPTARPIQAQPWLAGPVRGIGGPAPGMMQLHISLLPQLSAPPLNYPALVIRPLGQMPGFPGQQPQMRLPPNMQFRPGGGPPPGPYQMPPAQFGQRLMQPPPQLMRGPPPPPHPGMPGQQPPRPGMLPPPGGAIPTFGPPLPGMPPPPPNQQQQQQQQQ